MSTTNNNTVHYTNEEYVEDITEQEWADWELGLPKCYKTGGNNAKYTPQVKHCGWEYSSEYEEIPF